MKTKKRILAMLLAVVLMLQLPAFFCFCRRDSQVNSYGKHRREPAGGISGRGPPPVAGKISDPRLRTADHHFGQLRGCAGALRAGPVQHGEIRSGGRHQLHDSVWRYPAEPSSGSWRPTRTTTTTWAPPMLAATPNHPTGTPPTTAAPWDELRRLYQLRPPQSRPGRGNHHGNHAPDAGESVRLRPALRLAGGGVQLQKP